MKRKITRLAFGAKCGFFTARAFVSLVRVAWVSLAWRRSASASRPKLFAECRSRSRRDKAGMNVLQKVGIGILNSRTRIHCLRTRPGSTPPTLSFDAWRGLFLVRQEPRRIAG